MQALKWFSLAAVALLLAACAKEEIAVITPPPPEPVYQPSPLILLEQAEAIPAGKRGPVGANISFTNISDDTYQYVLFRTTAYDKNGKIVKARKSLDESAYLRVAGPIAPGQFSSGHAWKNTWKSRRVHCLDIDQVEIIFTDGSVEVAKGERLTSNLGSSCSQGL